MWCCIVLLENLVVWVLTLTGKQIRMLVFEWGASNLKYKCGDSVISLWKFEGNWWQPFHVCNGY